MKLYSTGITDDDKALSKIRSAVNLRNSRTILNTRSNLFAHPRHSLLLSHASPPSHLQPAINHLAASSAIVFRMLLINTPACVCVCVCVCVRACVLVRNLSHLNTLTAGKSVKIVETMQMATTKLHFSYHTMLSACVMGGGSSVGLSRMACG